MKQFKIEYRVVKNMLEEIEELIKLVEKDEISKKELFEKLEIMTNNYLVYILTNIF